MPSQGHLWEEWERQRQKMTNFKSIDIDIDVYKYIENNRNSFEEKENDILRRLFSLEEGDNNSHIDLSSAPKDPENDFVTNGVRFPAGSKLRMRYKGQEYSALIDRRKIIYNNTEYTSLSRVSCDITDTARNGWNDWDILFPNTTTWKPVWHLRGY
jgi:hypothetical protein